MGIKKPQTIPGSIASFHKHFISAIKLPKGSLSVSIKPLVKIFNQVFYNNIFIFIFIFIIILIFKIITIYHINYFFFTSIIQILIKVMLRG